MRHLLLILCLMQTGSLLAQSPITAADDPIVIYKTEADFEEIRDNLEMAITDRGMRISSTLHISEMLDRTAKDTGLDKKVYKIAESMEFCSIAISYRMGLANPANLAICPLTIGYYVTHEEPDHVFLTYSRPAMLGEARAVEEELTRLLDGIVQEALE